jgi:endogenous inhibitor of DNA gyrase (YacG/DUF329 family)
MSSTCARRSSGERTQTQRKATLICPTCGHESPAGTDGDWTITETVDDTVRRIGYECPVCETSVVVQPQFENR